MIFMGLIMYKILIQTLLMLLIIGCSEQEPSEQELLNIQASMLKGLCKNESTCLNKIDTLAESCQLDYANNKNFDTLNERDQIRTIGEFHICIIKQMDQGFQDRFDQAMPVTETGVEISRPSLKTTSKGLLVRIMQENIRITEKSKQNKDIPLKDLKNFIENQKLAERYSLVLLFVDKNSNTGDLVEVMDIFKNAGIEQIHVSAPD